MGLTLFLQRMTLVISVQHFLLFNQVGIIYKCVVSSVCLVVIYFYRCVFLHYYIITSIRYETTNTKNSTVYYSYTTLIQSYTFWSCLILQLTNTSKPPDIYNITSCVYRMQNKTNHTVRTNINSIKENRIEAKSILLKHTHTYIYIYV